LIRRAVYQTTRRVGIIYAIPIRVGKGRGYTQRMNELRVLIAATDPLARAGLAALLADQPGISVIGQVAGDDLAVMLDVYRPEVVVWDVGWEGSAETLAALRTALDGINDNPSGNPAVMVLLPEASLAVEVWAGKPQGIILRDSPPAALTAALEALDKGLTVLDPAISEALLPQPHFNTENGYLTDDLTPRELEVLHLLAEGLPNKTIARQLGISEHTVKFHINALMGKLGAQSRTDAVVRATRQGLLIL